MLVAHGLPTCDTLLIPFPFALFPEEILYHQQSDTDNSNNFLMKDGLGYWNAALQLREEYLRFIRVLKSELSIHFKNFYAWALRTVAGSFPVVPFIKLRFEKSETTIRSNGRLLLTRNVVIQSNVLLRHIHCA
jgi:hypothetical protein